MSIKDWFNERYQIQGVIEKNVTEKLIPRGLSWFGCMGGLALVAFVIQVGTGIFLIFYYVPLPSEAFNSVQYIRHALPYGWLIQKVHAVTPHFMISLVFAHMLRILFKGIYKKPRELHWVSGASLLVLTLIICYTGSRLPANDLSYWGINSVGSEIGMPTVVADHAVGDYQDEGIVSTRSFVALYALHIACIPLLMCVFMGFHFLMVCRTGISGPL
ncbi:cytochrome b subunit of the bc complex [Candidatus Scalindua japonica]|uniref:Cytochrome b subunit of the bc complex n=1 Tax=Candidatus Scalindua japonica TaxID=1284222 RepID=A0A286TTU1_9BACT|nr:cytochrome b N-terminal domain-containing protein [Candidatus Scalindua japonica]GAX59296.1 cytochrome b subunit of the bc complex [Candidatus Scalindua japonica]